MIDNETLGRFMFGRNCADFTPNAEYVDELWDEEGIRQFWKDEAQAVLEWIDESGGLHAE